MTKNEKTVLREYQVRKTRKQKNAFTDYVSDYAKTLGYEIKVEKGSFGAKNILIGNLDTAKVVFTAHYDTCALMPLPNFITPKNIIIYLLYQLLLTAVIFTLSIVAGIVVALINPALSATATLICIYALLGLMMFGPANKHTANDNTSGVLTVLESMAEIGESERGKVAFILFDFEEVGLLGSAGFAAKHKKQMKNKLLVNFDCVSDGKHLLFVLNKKSKTYKPLIENACEKNDDFTIDIATKGVFYPSDQANFPLGVAVAALKKSKTGLLYMDRIHTKKDTVYQSENIAYLKSFCENLVRYI